MAKTTLYHLDNKPGADANALAGNNSSNGLRDKVAANGTTDAAGYAIGASAITLATVNNEFTGTENIFFAGDATEYTVDITVTAPGVINITPNLTQSIPASAIACNSTFGAKQTYDASVDALASYPANTELLFPEGCGYSHPASSRVTNANSVVIIDKILRTGTEATAFFARTSNLAVSDQTVLTGSRQIEYNGLTSALISVDVTYGAGHPYENESPFNFTWTVPGTPQTPATPISIVSGVTANVGYAIGSTVINITTLTGEFEQNGTIIFAGDSTRYNVDVKLDVPGNMTITPGLVVALPASSVIVDLVDQIRFDGGMITFKSYQSAAFTPVISNIKPYVKYTDTANAMHRLDVNNSSFEGLKFQNINYQHDTSFNQAPSSHCFFINPGNQCDTFILDGVVVDNFAIGIYPEGVGGEGGYGTNNLQIKNTLITNNITQGMYGLIENALFDNVTFVHNGHNLTGGTDREHNLYLSYVKNTLMKNCDFSRSAIDAGGKASGVSFVVHGTGLRFTMEDTYIHETIAESGGGGWSFEWGTGYSNAAPPEVFTDLIVRRCKFENGGSRSIVLEAAKRVLIEDNLGVNNHGIGGIFVSALVENGIGYDQTNSAHIYRNNSAIGDYVRFADLSIGSDFKMHSNILYSKMAGNIDFLNAPLTIADNSIYTGMDNNNLYAPNGVTRWETSRGLDKAGWIAANSNKFDVNSTLDDPQFTSIVIGSEDLQSLPGSLMINTGHLTESSPTDYTGKQRGATPDKGAFEFVSQQISTGGKVGISSNNFARVVGL